MVTSAKTGRINTSRLLDVPVAGRIIFRCVLRVLVFVAQEDSIAAAIEMMISFRISEYWMRKHNPALHSQN
jgi:hypothetical protein